MSSLKIYIVVRKDLEMPKGKLAAQAGHAVLHTFHEASEEDREDYLNGEHAYKITLGCKNEHALRRVHREAEDAGLPARLIVDKGFTVFDEPTATCVGIGPCQREDLPKYINSLQLL